MRSVGACGGVDGGALIANELVASTEPMSGHGRGDRVCLYEPVAAYPGKGHGRGKGCSRRGPFVVMAIERLRYLRSD
jgi:hypothetical protein